MPRRGSRQVASVYDRRAATGFRYFVVGPFAAPGVVVRVDWYFAFEGTAPINATYDVGFGLSSSGAVTEENFTAATNLVQRISSGLVGAAFVGVMRFDAVGQAPRLSMATWVEYQSGPVFVVVALRPSSGDRIDFLVTVEVERDLFDALPVAEVGAVKGSDESA